MPQCRNAGEKLVRGISSGSQRPQSGIGIPASGFSPLPLVTDYSGIAQPPWWKPPNIMQINPPIVFKFTRQRWSSTTPSVFNLPHSCEHHIQFFILLRCLLLYLNSINKTNLFATHYNWLIVYLFLDCGLPGERVRQSRGSHGRHTEIRRRSTDNRGANKGPEGTKTTY